MTAPTPASYPVTVVEPSPTLTKEASPTTVAAGDVVTYTLNASNATTRPPLHDSWVVDCLPAGLTFGGYLPADRTDVLPAEPGTGTNGCTSTETRLAWQPTSPNPTTPPTVLSPGTLLSGPANAVTLQYTATVSTSSAGLTSYTNKALSHRRHPGRPEPVDARSPDPCPIRWSAPTPSPRRQRSRFEGRPPSRRSRR